jgi:trigger factor
MERKLKKLEHCQTEVEVTFDKAEWEGAQNKAFDKLKKNVEVPGFRKGKAPDKMLRERIDQNKLLDEAVNSLLQVGWRAIIEEDKVEPYAQPQVEVKEFAPDKLVVKYTVTTAPEIKIGEYKGLKVGKESPEVTEKELNKEIDNLRDENSTLTTKEGEAADGDTVIIDFDGYVDGEQFEGGSSKNYELVLGSHYFIPGFEEQIVGHKPGDEFDVNVTFPEQYVENLKGKKATFKVVLHEVKVKVLPELNEEFVKELNIEGVNNVDELKASKKKELEENKTAQARGNYLRKLNLKIQEGSEIDIPSAVLDGEVEARKRDMEQRMAQSGFKVEQYLQVIGQTVEQYETGLRQDAEKNIRSVLVLQEVVNKEKIKVTKTDVDAEFAKMATQYNMKVEDVEKALANQVDQLRNQIALNKAEDFLFENND